MPRFDVVIVGAGSAGTVLASRLAEDPRRSVALIEAGPDQSGPARPAALDGADMFEALRTPGRLWPLLTARRSSGCAPSPYLAGRGVGGSSAINGMVVQPGLADDYDEWEHLGAVGWGWEGLSPWFTRTRLALGAAKLGEVGPLGSALLAALPRQAAPALLTRFPGGSRADVASVYLPSPRPPNVQVLADNAVARLLIERRRIAGVRCHDGLEVEAEEVILCAGAIHSPVLMLLSEIDTPGVGENLCDHPALGVALSARQHVEDDRSTPPTAASPVITVAARMSSGEQAADLQLLAVEHLGADEPGTAMLLLGLMASRSRGTVSLRGDDIEVELNLLHDESDIRRLRTGISQVTSVLQSEALRPWAQAEAWPQSDEALRRRLGGLYHAAGTCAMGTVVDAQCRVRGYEGLRVCDASIMPTLPRANPMLTIVAMAEYLASMLAAS